MSDLEKRELEREIAELRDEKMRNEVKLNDPERAFREHKQRGTQIEALLQDQATQMALGENRVHSALEAFSDLNYNEIDALFAESEERGIMFAAQSAYGRGLVAEDAIKWHDAYTHFKRAANLHDDLAHLNAYARMTWRLAKGGEAIQVHERLVTLVGNTDGKDSSAYATQLNNLASVVNAQGRFEEAEGLFREALAIDRATIGERHPEYATHLNNLASVVREQGRLEEAEGLFREALEIDRATIGEGHPDYAIHLNNLADVVQAQGRFEEAEGLYREALAIDRATIGEGHPDYATRLNNLASVVQAQGRFEEARPLFKQALTVFKATLPADHPNIVGVENNLASLPPAD